jgi:hypothetical protein
MQYYNTRILKTFIISNAKYLQSKYPEHKDFFKIKIKIAHRCSALVAFFFRAVRGVADRASDGAGDKRGSASAKRARSEMGSEPYLPLFCSFECLQPLFLLQKGVEIFES